MKSPVSILTEIPAELHESLQDYLENHPTWEQDTVFVAALSLFFHQNAVTQKSLAAWELCPCPYHTLDSETPFQQN